MNPRKTVGRLLYWTFMVVVFLGGAMQSAMLGFHLRGDSPIASFTFFMAAAALTLIFSMVLTGKES